MKMSPDAWWCITAIDLSKSVLLGFGESKDRDEREKEIMGLQYICQNTAMEGDVRKATKQKASPPINRKLLRFFKV